MHQLSFTVLQYSVEYCTVMYGSPQSVHEYAPLSAKGKPQQESTFQFCAVLYTGRVHYCTVLPSQI